MNKIYILKIGGKLLADSNKLDALLSDFAEFPGFKILVHGGGNLASELASQLGIEAKMHKGRRITDAAMIQVVTLAFSGLNKQLVCKLQALGCQAIGLCGADMDVMRAHKREGWDVDYGFAGDIDEVQGGKIFALLRQEIMPVFAPLSHDGQGQLLNTNADTVASQVAASLAAFGEVELLYSFELPGLMQDPSDPNSLIPHIDSEDFVRLKKSGVIADGMIPKLDNAFDALKAGVERVVICDPEGISRIKDQKQAGTFIRL